MRITIATISNRGIRPKTLLSLLEMVAHSKTHDIHVVVAEQGYTIAENRSYCVVQAIKNQSDYLLFVDDDMVFPKDTLERLLADNKDIVGVLSYSRMLPLSPTVGLMDENGQYMHPDKYPAWKLKIPQELFKAYFVGTGVMLINMSVFSRIPRPYFMFETNSDGKVTTGEDGYFCNKAREHGIDIWCDPTIPIKHLGEYAY